MSAPRETPSVAALVWSTLAAVMLAVVILVLVVLPAEYNVDPTGFGAAVGLAYSLDTGAVTTEAGAAAPRRSFFLADRAYRSETIPVEILGKQEVEYKLLLTEGATVVYEWQTDRGSVFSDLHAEPFDAPEGFFIRYTQSNATTGQHGSLTAPFSGYHGWYWRNDNDHPVAISLTVTGFHDGGEELYRAWVD